MKNNNLKNYAKKQKPIPTPQAKPEVVLNLWKALSSFNSFTKITIQSILDYKSRQNDYYLNALRNLDVINIVNKEIYTIKPILKSFNVTMRKKYFEKKVLNSIWLEKINKNMIELNYTGETLKRRKQDLEKWINFASSTYKETTLILSNNNNYNLVDLSKRKNNEKINIQTNKDKSYKHEEMKNKIIEYAKNNQIHLNQEVLGADLISINEKNQIIYIIEIKSYDGLYSAIGQLIYYSWKFQNLYSKYQIKKIYISNEKYSNAIIKFLNMIEIKYIKLEKKNLNNIFNNS